MIPHRIDVAEAYAVRARIARADARAAELDGAPRLAERYRKAAAEASGMARALFTDAAADADARGDDTTADGIRQHAHEFGITVEAETIILS